MGPEPGPNSPWTTCAAEMHKLDVTFHTLLDLDDVLHVSEIE